MRLSPTGLISGVILLAAWLTFAAVTCAAAVISFEQPDYAQGNLVGQDGWQTVRYGPAAHAVISPSNALSGSLSLRHDGTRGRSDVSRPVAAEMFADSTTLSYRQRILADSSQGAGSGLYVGSDPGGGFSPVWVRFLAGEIQAIQSETEARKFRPIGKYEAGKTYEVHLTLDFAGSSYAVVVCEPGSGTTNAQAVAIPMYGDKLPDPSSDTIGISLAQEGGVALFDDFRVQPGSVPFTPPRKRQLNVRLSWGHKSVAVRPFRLELMDNEVVAVQRITPDSQESDDSTRDRVVLSQAGKGDVDALRAELSWTEARRRPLKVQSIWQHLLDNGTPGQIARLKDDPGLQPGAPVLTVSTADDGTQGFSMGLEQLVRHRAMWLPDHDVFITLADAPVEFPAHLASLRGERVLDAVQRQPESTYAEWTNKWADFGNPTQPHHGQETSWLGTQGHLTGLIARHGSLYKFGVDRWGRVRPDYACPHKFRLDPLWSNPKWQRQGIETGLPVLLTAIEDSGHSYAIEQFAAPLGNGPPEAHGEVSSVCFTRFQVSGEGPVRLGFRLSTESKERHPELREVADSWCVVDRETGSIWLMIEPDSNLTIKPRAAISDDKNPSVEFECVGQLNVNATANLVLKLASPVVSQNEVSRLAALNFSTARSAIVDYWEDWLAQGAHFEVPEKAVNDLFRASLWHGLFLPRHRLDEKGVARIDLPYSNFAYGQYNADWPINQAVYVDYMIYGLRGYFDVAEEEFAAMYHTQQKPDGRVGGYAEWGVYSPSMLYSIAQNYLLSGDRESFERLLPASLQTLDWCLREVAKGQTNKSVPGLIVAPLNDLTHDSRAWGFPNGYFVAGLDVFARGLAKHGHPRAEAVASVTDKMRENVTRAFARASVKSPVVPLGDGTWINYVPCDAMTPRRLLEEWYPTDVDCGALHMSRLQAIDPHGWLTTSLLHDHEDNLFLNQWGMANEPVYNQQASAYLFRDMPEAAIRAFYSMIACAFSHHQLTPLEHRWAWGQYYMPPSTDGAWFELYRRMLIRETDDNGLFLCQAAPRRWFEQGKRITVRQAPTCFGPITFTFVSSANTGNIEAQIDCPGRERPSFLLVRFRHPLKQPLKSVHVNGEVWSDFDPKKEWVRIPSPAAGHYRISARY